MAKSISTAIIIVALTVANLLPAAECNGNRGGGGGGVPGEDDFNDRVSKTGGEMRFTWRPLSVGTGSAFLFAERNTTEVVFSFFLQQFQQ